MPSRQGTGHDPVQVEPEGALSHPAVAAFAAELRHWREVTGCSQKSLAALVDYTPSYISKVESRVCAGQPLASPSRLTSICGPACALLRRWKKMHDALAELPGSSPKHEDPSSSDPENALGYDLVVEHEQAELTYRDGKGTRPGSGGSCATPARGRSPST